MGTNQSGKLKPSSLCFDLSLCFAPSQLLLLSLVLSLVCCALTATSLHFSPLRALALSLPVYCFLSLAPLVNPLTIPDQNGLAASPGT
jgi:hypothetical protein